MFICPLTWVLVAPVQANLGESTSTFALFRIFSAVSAPSSSIRAGKNVPLPSTSCLAAAYSDATVSASTLDAKTSVTTPLRDQAKATLTPR